MNLEQNVNDKHKEAMKAKLKDRVDALRDIRKSIIEFNKSGTGEELNDDKEIKLLNQLAKKRRDAIDMYKNANRPELIAKEEAELEVIQEFLPNQLSEEELREIVLAKIEAVGASGPSDFGKVMGSLVKELAGKADGKSIQAIVKEKLS